MIISASRRTDIPAFYGEWFINRINEGYFYRINPFNKNQIKGFSLNPSDVDAIVFWTKNPEPFFKYLDILDSKNYNYYFQYTLNNYSKIFEPNMTDIEKRIDSFIKLSHRIGKERVIWRYDPIIFSSITDVKFHLKNIEYIAKKLNKSTCRLIISYLDIYDKVKSRIKAIEHQNSIRIYDIDNGISKDEIYSFSINIKSIADTYGIQVFSCAEAIDLKSCGIQKGSCIDGEMIKKLFKIGRNFKKDKNQRPECLCSESVDMGVYNTCKFGCVYCYANYSQAILNNNIKKHILASASMIDDFGSNIGIIKEKKTEKPVDQISIF